MIASILLAVNGVVETTDDLPDEEKSSIRQMAPGSELPAEALEGGPAKIQASPDARDKYARWAQHRAGGEEDRAPSPTTRQEDTEIGIFRPDEL